MKNGFSFKVENDCVGALKEVIHLKAFKIRNDDRESNFSDLYFHVQYEVDMFNEGEESLLSKTSVLSAEKWLNKYRYLFLKYENNR